MVVGVARVELERVADHGDPLEPPGGQAGECLDVRVVGQCDAGRQWHLAGSQQTCQVPPPIVLPADAVLVGVVLVADLADDFRDQVLEGHDAVDVAPFVDDHRELQRLQQRGELQARRHQHRRRHHVADRHLAAALVGTVTACLMARDADDVL